PAPIFMDRGLPLPSVAGRAVDVRHDERDPAMDQCRKMRQVRTESRTRLAFGSAMRIENRRCRSAGAAGAVHEAWDLAVGAGDADELRLDELTLRDRERRAERDARVAGRGVERPDLPWLGRRQPRERGARSVRRDHEVLAGRSVQAMLADRTGSDTPAQGRIPVLVHRPDLRSTVGGRRRELDIPVRTIDRLVRSGLNVERAEPEVIAIFVGDHDGASVGEPTRWNVRVVLRMPGDLACVTTTRIHHEKTLRRV